LRKSFNPVEFNGQKLLKPGCFVQRGFVRDHFCEVRQTVPLTRVQTKNDGCAVLSAVSRVLV